MTELIYVTATMLGADMLTYDVGIARILNLLCTMYPIYRTDVPITPQSTLFIYLVDKYI
jgi:hypothetical protein